MFLNEIIKDEDFTLPITNALIMEQQPNREGHPFSPATISTYAPKWKKIACALDVLYDKLKYAELKQTIQCDTQKQSLDFNDEIQAAKDNVDDFERKHLRHADWTPDNIAGLRALGATLNQKANAKKHTKALQDQEKMTRAETQVIVEADAGQRRSSPVAGVAVSAEVEEEEDKDDDAVMFRMLGQKLASPQLPQRKLQVGSKSPSSRSSVSSATSPYQLKKMMSNGDDAMMDKISNAVTAYSESLAKDRALAREAQAEERAALARDKVEERELTRVQTEAVVGRLAAVLETSVQSYARMTLEAERIREEGETKRLQMQMDFQLQMKKLEMQSKRLKKDKDEADSE